MTKRDELIALGGVGAKVRELEWNEYTDERGDPDRWDAETLAGTFYGIALLVDGFSIEYDYTAVAKGLDDLEAAKAAAQTDYEQRIRSAIEIAPQSDRQPLPGQKQISETGKELPKNTEQPMNNADVSVGELAGFFVTEFPHLLTMSTQIEVARALLARYRIERLDRLESGRK